MHNVSEGPTSQSTGVFSGSSEMFLKGSSGLQRTGCFQIIIKIPRWICEMRRSHNISWPWNKHYSWEARCHPKSGKDHLPNKPINFSSCVWRASVLTRDSDRRRAHKLLLCTGLRKLRNFRNDKIRPPELIGLLMEVFVVSPSFEIIPLKGCTLCHYMLPFKF